MMSARKKNDNSEDQTQNTVWISSQTRIVYYAPVLASHFIPIYVFLVKRKFAKRGNRGQRRAIKHEGEAWPVASKKIFFLMTEFTLFLFPPKFCTCLRTRVPLHRPNQKETAVFRLRQMTFETVQRENSTPWLHHFLHHESTPKSVGLLGRCNKKNNKTSTPRVNDGVQL